MAGFLDLPVEIRWQIYRHVPKTKSRIVRNHQRFRVTIYEDDLTDLTLLAINKQIRDEAKAILNKNVDYELHFHVFEKGVYCFVPELAYNLRALNETRNPSQAVSIMFKISFAASHGTKATYTRCFREQELPNGSVLDPQGVACRWRDWLGAGDWKLKMWTKFPMQTIYRYSEGHGPWYSEEISGRAFVETLDRYLGD